MEEVKNKFYFFSLCDILSLDGDNMSSTFFQICSLFYIVLLIAVYFLKKPQPSIENKLFIIMAVANLIGLILDITSIYTIKIKDTIPFINNIVCKSYLIYLLTFISFMTIYIFCISKNKNEKSKVLNAYYARIYRNIMIIFSISILIILILRLYYNNTDNLIYSYGPAANFLYLISGAYIISWIVVMLKNFKHLKSKKYLPMFGYLIIGSIVIYIQMSNPELLLMSSMETFVLMLMYFTIENPDIKTINELERNKLLVEKTFEEKSNFLFKMTQEVKKPINNIKSIIDTLKNSDNKNELKQGIKLLDANSRQLDFVVNDVLDITTLDTKNIKILNNRYNVYNLFKDIEKRMADYASNDVEFRFNINENIPYLYGDAIKLKQIIMSILLNSVKKTKSGFIELSVDAIEKYDVCRLIIEIEDSGVGMSIDKINEVMVTTSELDIDDIKNLEKLDINLKLCQKSIKLLGGNLMIRSEVNKGTEVIITIDQKIYQSEFKDNEIEEKTNLNKILVVSYKEEDIEIIKKVINDDTVLINNSFYGKDAIQRIKTGKKYDLIIIEDELPTESGLSIMQELKKIDKFKIPVVVVLDKDKENIKEHYIKDGFNDYILKSNIEEDLLRVIDKYC